jgi:hypothetical protein
MNVEKRLDHLKNYPLEALKPRLRSVLSVCSTSDVLSLTRSVVGRWDAEPAEYDSLLSALCDCIPLGKLPPVAKSNIADTIRPLLLTTTCVCRKSVFGLLLRIHATAPAKVLQTCFAVADSQSELSAGELAQLMEYLWTHTQENVDDVLKNLQTCHANHQGNCAANSLLVKIQEDLCILKLEELSGPEIRQAYFSRIVDRPGAIDEHIFIGGPSGCGKTTLVEIIHSNGRRRNTQLRRYGLDRVEKWEHLVRDVNADPSLAGGVVFLDELRALPGSEAFQKQLLTGPAEKDIQVLSASSEKIQSLSGTLVPDFFGRYCDNIFMISPLRERLADFAAYCKEVVSNKHGMNIATDVPDLLLRGYDWPHNYRELSQFLSHVCEHLPRKTPKITKTVLVRNLAVFDAPFKQIIERALATSD